MVYLVDVFVFGLGFGVGFGVGFWAWVGFGIGIVVGLTFVGLFVFKSRNYPIVGKPAAKSEEKGNYGESLCQAIENMGKTIA